MRSESADLSLTNDRQDNYEMNTKFDGSANRNKTHHGKRAPPTRAGHFIDRQQPGVQLPRSGGTRHPVTLPFWPRLYDRLLHASAGAVYNPGGRRRAVMIVADAVIALATGFGYFTPGVGKLGGVHRPADPQPAAFHYPANRIDRADGSR
jgi:hypothetical protein